MPHSAIRTSRSSLVEANRIGWAASGRNGGFVDASLTHGLANGKARWPNEIETLEAMGLENLDGMQADIERLGLDVEWQRTGMLSVATEPHQVAWLAEAADDGEGRFLAQRRGPRRGASPTYLAGLFSPDTLAIVHPAKLAFELARACGEAGVQIFEHTNAHVDRSSGPAVRLRVRRRGDHHRRSRGACDERLSEPADAQPAAHRAGVRLRAGHRATHRCPARPHRLGEQTGNRRLRQPVSLLPADSADNRIVWGGYDAVYQFGRKVEARLRGQARHAIVGSPRTSSSPFPQLDDVRFSHRWAGAIDTNTRFCAHWGLAHDGRVAYANGFTGLGVGAARFAADVCLDLLDGRPTPRTELEMVRRRPLPFPPEPLASIGIQATRWSLDRADHSAGRRNCCCARSMRSGSGSIPERALNVYMPFGWARSEPPTCPTQISKLTDAGFGEKTSGRYGGMSPSERGNHVSDRLA